MRGDRGRLWPGGRALALAGVVAGVVALAGCGASPAGGGGEVAVWHLPVGWHEITPPDGRSMASYAVSPDVPGLIVACIGAPVNHTSASPMGPATLWRTRDGGAHWQALDVRGLSAGCAVTMPRGGRGTIFVLNALPPTGQQTLIASGDGGETWRTIQFAGDAPANLQEDVEQLIERGVMRDGRLYAVGMLGALGLMGQPGGPFAVSDDLGATWTRVEAGSDPLEQRGYVPIALAADYRAAGAWYRLLTFSGGSGSNAVSGQPTLEHSADGGRTWRVVGTAGTANWLAGADGLLSGALATTPAAPTRLCLALEVDMRATASRSAPTASGMLRAALSGASWPHGLDGADHPSGPPAPMPHNDILAGSGDGGLSWQGGIIAEHRRDYGRVTTPGVTIDARGACVAADSISGALESQGTRATFYRLAPGAGAPPASIGTLSGLNLELTTLSQASAGGGERLLAVTRAIIIRSCSYSCADGRVNDVSAAHLIWRDAAG